MGLERFKKNRTRCSSAVPSQGEFQFGHPIHGPNSVRRSPPLWLPAAHATECWLHLGASRGLDGPRTTSEPAGVWGGSYEHWD